MAAIRCGSGKAKLPPIPPIPATAAASASAAVAAAGSAPKQVSSTSLLGEGQGANGGVTGSASQTLVSAAGRGSCHEHVGAVLNNAAGDCNTLLRQLVQQAEQVERDVETRLREAIREATTFLAQELAAAQTRFETEKAELSAQVKKLALDCAEWERKDQESQSTICTLKKREETLVKDTERLSASLCSAQKAHQDADDALNVQRLEHQKELQSVMDKYGSQLSEIDKSGEESKKRNQQLNTQIKQLRDANNKLTSKLSEEEALRQKLEKQRKDDHTASTSTSKKLTLELSTLKSQLSQCQQDLAKANRAAEQYEKQLTRQQNEHSDAMKKSKSHHASVVTGLNEKIEQLESEMAELRMHYQAEIERLRKEMAEKMHASLDNWLGGDDALLKKLRKQNQEEKGKLDAERLAVGSSKKKSNRL
ncbi:paramyosin-like [Sycon ciliatum]|uniref:paramyosin-like n=1 Tax=Sycon ciliatum TaxID=27933 RepID=UPI0031F697CD